MRSAGLRMIICCTVDGCVKSMRNLVLSTSKTSATGVGRTAPTAPLYVRAPVASVLNGAVVTIPTFEDPLVVPRAPMSLGELLAVSASRPIRVGAELVELHDHRVDAAEPVALVQPIEQLELAALDVDHHDVDPVERKLREHAVDVADLQVHGTEEARLGRLLERRGPRAADRHALEPVAATESERMHVDSYVVRELRAEFLDRVGLGLEQMQVERVHSSALRVGE